MIALMSGLASTPPRPTWSSAFQSIVLSVTSKPAASSCDLINSFIGSGCICPDPEVEIANLTLHGVQPASFSIRVSGCSRRG